MPLDMAAANGPRIKLLRSISSVALRILGAPQFALPQESKGKQQDRKADGSNRVEHVGHSHACDPWGHGKDEDGAHRVPRERERHQGIADDLVMVRLARVPPGHATWD
jgi:hypothetical protein